MNPSILYADKLGQLTADELILDGTTQKLPVVTAPARS